MRIVNLMENTKGKNDCRIEHGLSFYIETSGHKILLDTGQSNAFLENARILGVDLTKVDIVILSHGHYDHAGGMLGFMEQNPTAKIWMQKTAGGQYYHKSDSEERYIGIDARILDGSQVCFMDGNGFLDESLFLFSQVKGRKLWPSGNKDLKIKQTGGFRQDEFEHEQYLVIQEDGKKVLISGCAHNGILNILEEYERMYGEAPDLVISGFHMQKKNGYSQDDLQVICEIAKELKKRHNTRFYTGHCTGEIPYQIMKEYMGEQLTYVHCGDSILCSGME